MEILRLNIDQKQPDRPGEAEIRFQIGLLAGTAATVAGFIGRFVFQAPLVPELMAQFIFGVAPIWAVELMVGLLGPFAKHLAFLACVVLHAFGLIAAGVGYLRYVRQAVPSLGIGMLTVFLLVLELLVVIPLLGGGPLGSQLRQGVWLTALSQLAVCSAYGFAFKVAWRLYLEPGSQTNTVNRVISRRRLVRGVGYAVIAVAAYDIARQFIGSWFFFGSGRVRGGDGVFPNIDGLALEVTPTADFYKVSKNAFDPEVDVRRWEFEVTGLVENPLILTYEDIRSLPSVEHYATLACISNEVGGDLIGNALWRGVKLSHLLAKATLKPGVVDIVLRARDDYSDSIPLDRAMMEGTLLAYEMNDQPLTPEHGFPVRLLVPGIYGMKNVKWISRIEAVDYDFKGYWQRRGWDDRAEYKTLSRIDVPESTVTGETAIAGIAFAGDRGISKVEISFDGGQSWEPADIRRPLSPFTWVLWHKSWTPGKDGRHKLLVRATDGRGQTQTSQYAPPAPSGSSGYHSRIVTSSLDS